MSMYDDAVAKHDALLAAQREAQDLANRRFAALMSAIDNLAMEFANAAHRLRKSTNVMFANGHAGWAVRFHSVVNAGIVIYRDGAWTWAGDGGNGRFTPTTAPTADILADPDYIERLLRDDFVKELSEF